VRPFSGPSPAPLHRHRSFHGSTPLFDAAIDVSKREDDSWARGGLVYLYAKDPSVGDRPKVIVTPHRRT
jgi:hypothetical protein